MQLTAIILLTTCLAASAAGHTQGVTLKMKDAPLEKVFSEIRKQTGYNFLFSSKELKDAGKVTVQVSSASVEQVLSICFKDKPFTWVIDNNTIVVKRNAGETKQSPNADGGSEQLPPPIDVKGKITNEAGEPVAASIIVKGTQQGTTTNADGFFELKNVDENATLVISGVSIETKEIRLNGKSELMIAATTKVTSLNEVVINKGYYTEKQRFSVGNVGKVTAKDIEEQPVSNPLLALQGRVPGLFVTQTSGLPGGGVAASVQGQNSLLNGNDPLYVIDGVPYGSQLLQTTIAGGRSGEPSILWGGSPFSFINAGDIESIEILKDADATAIYGSRAANGAILITTKKGKSGRTKVGFNIQQGWGKVGHKMDLLNSQQYLEMRKEAYTNDGIPIPSPNPNATSNYDLTLWDNTRNTDWQKELIGGTANYTNISTSISGGSSMIQYLVGGTYHRETTVFPTKFSDQKASSHFNIHSVSANQKFSFQFSGNYTSDNNQLPRGDLTSTATRLAPVAPALYKADGSLNWAPNANGSSTWSNPLASLFATYQNKTDNLIANAILNYSILPGLDVKCSFGYNNLHSDEVIAVPQTTLVPEATLNLRQAIYANSIAKLWIIEPQLSYRRTIGKGKFEALVGSTLQENNSNGQTLRGTGYNTDAVIKDINSASSISVMSSFQAVYKYDALFGRLNYNLMDKYILSLTGRRDGSSRFGEKNQFHNFGSVGAAWIFTQESFLKNSSFLTYGKIKGSFGTTGNDQIGDYTFMNLYTPINLGVGYQNTTGLILNGLPNPYLQWEETKKLQFGIDLGFLRDRILLNATYARNRSSNQLLDYSLPSTTGNNSITENFPAKVQNTSWEFSLNTTNVKSKSFSWNSNINLTIPQNKLIAFPGLSTSTYAGRLIIGQPISVQKVFHFAGVNPTTGLYQFTDKSGKITSSPDYANDRTVLINTFPKFYGGFQNGFTYKRFQLDVLLQWVKQMGVDYSFYPVSVPGKFLSGNGNQSATTLGRWQKPGDITNIQRFSQDNRYRNYSANVSNSDGFWTDASFARLRNLSLSYLMSENWLKKVHFQSCRIYLSGQNLFTITKYNGLDPESPDINNTGRVPALRVITFGLQLEL